MIPALYEDFHVLNLCGITFHIGDDERGEIENMLKNAEKPWDFVIVSDLAGHEVTVVVDSISAIWSSTRASRDADRAVNKALELEEL